MYKKCKAILVTIACAISMNLTLIQEQDTASAAFTQTAAEVVADIGFGWNLGNTLDSYGGTDFGTGSLSTETSWGNPTTTQAMIDMVKETGINAIRVPVTWYNHMDSAYQIDAAWMARVKEIVDYVLEDGTYCIINAHHDTGVDGWLKASSTNLDQKKEIFTAIWTQVSESFAGYGDRLLFEGFNEILNDSNEWVTPDAEALSITNDLNQIFVNTVRATGGNNANRNLLVNTYCAGGNSQVTGGFVLPSDTVTNRLIVEAHVYQPFYFTSESYPEVTTWDKSGLYSYITNMYTTFVQEGIPVIIGEFGCVDKNNAQERLSWAEYYVSLCKGYGIKCFWWDNGSQYKIFNRKTLTVAEPVLLSTMLEAATGTGYVQTIVGDVTADGQFSVADAVALQKWLIGAGELANWTAGDLDDNGALNAFDLCLMKRRLCSAGTQENLCADLDNWTSWIDESTGAAAEVTYLQDGIQIAVSASGEAEWYIQGSYPNLTLEEGASYQISFDYAADQAVSLYYHIQQNYDPYGQYFYELLSYTTQTQHYSKTFTMLDETDNNVICVFNCGGAANQTPFTVTIRNLCLIKLS